MVSVVIACYNVEKYVEEAVRSVMNQTLRDIEIICVDDCSQDGTLAILERLAVEDSRIRIIQHKSNQGTLSVRCHGIQEATGEYVTFLDGDDWLSAETCKEALKVAEEQNVDIVQFAPVLFETQNTPSEQVLSLERVMAPCKESLSREKGALGCVSKVPRIKELCKPDKASCQIYHAQEAPCKLLETHSHSTIIFDFHKEALYQVALLVVEIITFPRL